MDEIKRTAEDAYVDAYLNAEELLGSIEELLADRPAPSEDFRPDWGHVGSLGYVNERLAEIIEFLQS